MSDKYSELRLAAARRLPPADLLSMRKNHTAHEDNNERWLVSYADFITLLFAFFVVMFASSTVDQAKVESFAAHFEEIIEGRPIGSTDAGVRPDSAPSETATQAALTMAELRASIEQLETELLPEIQQGKIELSLQPRGLVMSLREAAFFAPGEAELQPQTKATMTKVAGALTRIPGEIRLEGHTDDRPIQTRRFPSNWQLSAARAITVLRLLIDDYKISASRLAVAGYGEHFPLVPNDGPESRAKNRRVDVVILTKKAAALEPQAAAPPA